MNDIPILGPKRKRLLFSPGDLLQRVIRRDEIYLVIKLHKEDPIGYCLYALDFNHLEMWLKCSEYEFRVISRAPLKEG